MGRGFGGLGAELGAVCWGRPGSCANVLPVDWTTRRSFVPLPESFLRILDCLRESWAGICPWADFEGRELPQGYLSETFPVSVDWPRRRGGWWETSDVLVEKECWKETEDEVSGGLKVKV